MSNKSNVTNYINNISKEKKNNFFENCNIIPSQGFSQLTSKLN